jgi:single-stranded-DNA-specific exonuclease
VVYHPQWHKGVIGIVASRLIEQFYRPTIVLTNSGGVVSGSARSIPGFNLHDGLDACADLLLGYGGHYFAAGMTLEASQVKAFRDRFERIVRERLPEDMMFPEILVHAELDFSGITEKFFRQLKRLEPFGPENPEPVFLTRGATMVGKSRIAKEKHLQFSMSRDGKIFKCFGFNLAQKQSLLDGGPVHMVYTIDENEWNGSRSLQLKVLDLKAADATAIGPFR